MPNKEACYKSSSQAVLWLWGKVTTYNTIPCNPTPKSIMACDLQMAQCVTYTLFIAQIINVNFKNGFLFTVAINNVNIIFLIFFVHERCQCNAKCTQIIIVWVINKVDDRHGTMTPSENPRQRKFILCVDYYSIDSIYHAGDHVIKDYV